MRLVQDILPFHMNGMECKVPNKLLAYTTTNNNSILPDNIPDIRHPLVVHVQITNLTKATLPKSNQSTLIKLFFLANGLT